MEPLPCKVCGQMPALKMWPTGCCEPMCGCQRIYNTRELAIAAWNTRNATSEPPHREGPPYPLNEKGLVLSHLSRENEDALRKGLEMLVVAVAEHVGDPAYSKIRHEKTVASDLIGSCDPAATLRMYTRNGVPPASVPQDATEVRE